MENTLHLFVTRSPNLIAPISFVIFPLLLIKPLRKKDTSHQQRRLAKHKINEKYQETEQGIKDCRIKDLPYRRNVWDLIFYQHHLQLLQQPSWPNHSHPEVNQPPVKFELWIGSSTENTLPTLHNIKCLEMSGKGSYVLNSRNLTILMGQHPLSAAPMLRR